MTKPSRTAAATAARMRNRQDRLASELRAAGWVVFEPEKVPAVPEDFEVVLQEGTPECFLAEQGYLVCPAARAAELTGDGS